MELRLAGLEPGAYIELGRLKAAATEDPLAGTKVTVFSNGPMRIEGDFTIVDQDGKEFGLGGRTAVSLCRCGHTANSPFCDGTHKRNNFVSAVEARDLPPKP